MIGERRLLTAQDLVVTIAWPRRDGHAGDRTGFRQIVERSQQFVEVAHRGETHPAEQTVGRLDVVETVDPDELRKAVAGAAQPFRRLFDPPPEERPPDANSTMVGSTCADHVTAFEPLGGRQVVRRRRRSQPSRRRAVRPGRPWRARPVRRRAPRAPPRASMTRGTPSCASDRLWSAHNASRSFGRRRPKLDRVHDRDANDRFPVRPTRITVGAHDARGVPLERPHADRPHHRIPRGGRTTAGLVARATGRGPRRAAGTPARLSGAVRVGARRPALDVVMPGPDALAAPAVLRLLPRPTSRTPRFSASWPHPGSASRA